ncbi:YheC/YheD family protein [Neobacillus sp. NPDC097160]|uniref:YheC/YheD family endospore coat-associated protein n=1 Tax=Neobacillus sp. NPDC097160 TaxID=3364298 RepID=UPI0037F8DC67
MSFSLIPIKLEPKKPTQKIDGHIQMSHRLFTRLHLKDHRELNIALGQKTITTTVQTVEMAANEIHIPDDLIKAIDLPVQAYKFHAMFLPESYTLKLGPVIGLLTDFPSNKTEDPHFRSVHLFCEELHHGITENGGFFYVFSYDKFPSQGYYFENEKWIPAQLPMPDVIYNRIHSRKLEYSKLFQQFRQKLDKYSIPFFNDRFLSKWEVYEQLKDEIQLDPYIPETHLFSKETFQDFSEKYDTLFLKPIHGSQGRNIIKLKREADHQYSFQTSFTTLSGSNNQRFPLEEIYQQIKPLLNNRIYLIQQGITLVTHELKAMDFRVLVHKNPANQWTVTSTVARIAAEKEFVSNLARGGTITRPLNALRFCMSHKQSLEVLSVMKELALETASAISRNSEGITGELGIDIGVDQDRKPWVIEVNSKPSKNFEDGLGNIRPSAKAIILFSTKLAFE